MKATRSFFSGLGFKVLILGFLVLFMLVPVSLVRELVRERSYRADEVEAELVAAWGGSLGISGPLLRIPVREWEEIRSTDAGGREIRELRHCVRDFWISPTSANLEANLDTTVKKRGIFSVPLYGGTVLMQGAFDLHEALASLSENQTALLEQAEIVIALADQKGLVAVETARGNDGELDFKPGNLGLAEQSGGIHAPLVVKEAGAFPYQIQLAVQGGRYARFLPLGKETSLRIRSNWASPSFQGYYLPASSRVDATGFDARWQNSYLSRAIPLHWQDSEDVDQVLAAGYYGVDFMTVLDQYALNERAVKYAILFIIVPFLTLFLLEMLTKKEIHPVQYLLAGIGNVVFYLLLLSLSEHLAFNLAYLVSAAALTAMMYLYGRSLLRSGTQAWYLVPVMIVSYLFMFITLQSEDWALLIGSLLAFAVTALVMFVTRRVDWYGRRTRVADPD